MQIVTDKHNKEIMRGDISPASEALPFKLEAEDVKTALKSKGRYCFIDAYVARVYGWPADARLTRMLVKKGKRSKLESYRIPPCIGDKLLAPFDMLQQDYLEGKLTMREIIARLPIGNEYMLQPNYPKIRSATTKKKTGKTKKRNTRSNRVRGHGSKRWT